MERRRNLLDDIQRANYPADNSLPTLEQLWVMFTSEQMLDIARRKGTPNSRLTDSEDQALAALYLPGAPAHAQAVLNVLRDTVNANRATWVAQRIAAFAAMRGDK